MIVTAHVEATNGGTKQIAANLRSVSRDELATIWFALEYYERSVREELQGTIDNDDLEAIKIVTKILNDVVLIQSQIEEGTGSERWKDWLDI